MRKLLLIGLFLPLVGFGQELSKDSLTIRLEKVESMLKIQQSETNKLKKELAWNDLKLHYSSRYLKTAGTLMVLGVVGGIVGSGLAILGGVNKDFDFLLPVGGVISGLSLISFTIGTAHIISTADYLDPGEYQKSYFMKNNR